MEHGNCIPYLSRQPANKRSKPNDVLHRVEILEVYLPSAENAIKNTKRELTQKVCGEEATRIREMKRQIENEMQQKRRKLEELDKYSQVFSSNTVVPLFKTLCIRERAMSWQHVRQERGLDASIY